MLRHLKSTGFVVLALAGLAFLVWGISGSHAFKSCFEEQKHYDTYKALYERGNVVLKSIVRLRLNGECALSVFKENTEAITAISTALLAVITLFVAWIARNQYRTTRAQLRAYVHVDRVGRAQYPEVPPGDWFFINTKNFGETPAYFVETYVTFRVILGEKRIFSEPDRQPGKSAMAPGQVEHLVEPIDISNSARQDIIERKGAVYIWGKILYRDAFRRKHTTNFRFRSIGKGLHPGDFEPDEEGNEAN